MDTSNSDFCMDGDDEECPFPGDFGGSSLNQAKFYVKQFFSDKKFHSGGQIPDSLLNQSRYLDFVLYVGIAEATTAIYESIDTSSYTFEEEAVFSESSNMVITILAACKQSGIPKCFAGGLLLMYVELCEGIKIGI